MSDYTMIPAAPSTWVLAGEPGGYTYVEPVIAWEVKNQDARDIDRANDSERPDVYAIVPSGQRYCCEESDWLDVFVGTWDGAHARLVEKVRERGRLRKEAS
jgi:hypothetical protein